MILFNDLKLQYEQIREEIDFAMQKVLSTGRYILGEELDAFEKEFAEYIGADYCVGVASGTDAITLLLMALSIGENDEVITTNLTAFPSIVGIIRSGASPVVVDICTDDGLIDCGKIEERITEKTRAIMPVHLYGQTCNMDRITALADKYGLKYIEEGDIRFVAARVEDALPEIPDADVIVVNPPRTGLSKPVRARLRKLNGCSFLRSA